MRGSVRQRVVALLVAALIVGVLVTVVSLQIVHDHAGPWGPDASSVSCDSRTCDSNYLSAVSCARSSFCVAVGYYRTPSEAEKTLIEERRRRSWFVVKSPNTRYGKDKLAGVSCTSSMFCMAVGWDNVFESGFTNLIEEWNGSTWRLIDRQPSMFEKLESVQCFSAEECFAVGYEEKTSSIPQTLVDEWNGTSWSELPSPNEPGADVMFNELRGLSCADPSFCVAVGDFETLNNVQGAEAERWDGTAWTLMPPPSHGSSNSSLAAVSCLSDRQCFAVGSGDDDPPRAGSRSRIEHWDGSTWKDVAIPRPRFANDVVSGIWCVGADLCFAVGVQHRDAASRSLLYEWNGRVWVSATPPVSFASGGIPLDGVTCVNAADCYVVGSYANDGGARLSLIEHWDGSAWRGVSAPNYFG